MPCERGQERDSGTLAEALRELGYDVWYDEFELGLGDSLRETIERGLARSRFGVVILSKRFFEKKWTQHELNGLTAREIIGSERVLLPVWHGIDERFLIDVAPSLADRVAVRTDDGLSSVVDAVAGAIERRRAGPHPATTVDASPPLPADPTRLIEARTRVRLGYTEPEIGVARGGGGVHGAGWLSVIVGPVNLRQDLLDPTELRVDQLQPVAVQGLWDMRNPPLLGLHLVPTLEGFTARFPDDPAQPPIEEVKLHEDGLMEFGKAIGHTGFAATGDPVQDRVIATHSIADNIHDWTLTFLQILEHRQDRADPRKSPRA